MLSFPSRNFEIPPDERPAKIGFRVRKLPDAKTTFVSPSQQWFGYLYNNSAYLFSVDQILKAPGGKQEISGSICTERNAQFKTGVLTNDYLWVVLQADNIRVCQVSFLHALHSTHI